MIRVGKQVKPDAASSGSPQGAQPEEEAPLSLADDIRQRIALKRSGIAPAPLPSMGSPFFLFSKGDMVVFAIILVALYVIVLVEHKIDLAQLAWVQLLRPNYDDADDGSL